jgi:hypothetical protein
MLGLLAFLTDPSGLAGTAQDGGVLVAGTGSVAISSGRRDVVVSHFHHPIRTKAVHPYES